MKDIDFTKYKFNPYRGYGGRNGNKSAILIDGENYMLKLPPRSRDNPELSYINSSVSEHISCNIFRSVGIESQETILGKYENKLAVACKDFNTEDFRLMEFALLKNQIIESSGKGYGTELSEILSTTQNQSIIDPEIVTIYFWDMFIMDALLGNFDRHNANWGFLVNEKTSTVKMSPIYDCGSCLYPQLTDENMANILKDSNEIEMRIYTFPNSIIENNGVKINYHSFLAQTENEDCLNSLIKIYNKIDMDKINEIINETPYISDIAKEFYSTMIAKRKNNILKKAIEIQNLS